MFLLRVAKILEKTKVEYALVGGYAVAFHGAVRGTMDIDLIINLSEKDFVLAEKALHSLGLESRLPVKADQIFKFRMEYIQNRNLIAWNFYNPKNPTEMIDIIITHDLKATKVVTKIVGGVKIKIASIPDLIKMKKLSGRPQDLADIEALKRLENE